MIPSDWSTHTYIQKLVARTPTYRQDFSAIMLRTEYTKSCTLVSPSSTPIAKNIQKLNSSFQRTRDLPGILGLSDFRVLFIAAEQVSACDHTEEAEHSDEEGRHQGALRPDCGHLSVLHRGYPH